MSILIPGTEPGVFAEPEIPMTYNPGMDAWENTEGYAYRAGAWEKVYPDDRELVVFNNGLFKNLPGDWEQDNRGHLNVDIIDGGLLKFQGSGAVYNVAYKTGTIDLSKYTKMYIDVVETDSNPSYLGAMIVLKPYGRWGLMNTMLGGVEVPFDDFQRTADLTGKDLDKVHFGLYCNYSYYAIVKKISFRK